MPRKRKNKTPVVLPPDLTPKEMLFVEHYMGNGFNAGRAATDAKFSAKSARTTGPRLLQKAAVRAEIMRRREALSENLRDVSEDRIREEISRCALFNMGDILVTNDDGSPRLDLQHMTRAQSAALQEVTVEEFRDGRTRARQVRRIRVKLVPKQASLELLAKTKGMITDKVDHTHKHQGLIVHALLQEIDANLSGRPIVEVAPPPTDEEAA